ncbi:hypothetical protein PR202_gb27524 [Eleusine coracana subsp. coracana]|uniref:TF-B3 domain-containing protein n=1 Tax=Eleusine coracana subsp. coracana TaxID=191504 RepID=A0AAV5FUS0_ELECO|nr:hypothetical protein PR202_gb27524 [Eleusine coracana subsp. coracana]
MAAPGNVAARRDTRVLLPFTCDSLRIPDELAEEIGATDAYVAVPICKGKVQRVEIGKDGDGAFLGRGWPEIAAKFGIGAGWFLVLRHHGRGMLTLKAFDDSGCLRELPASTPAAAVEATTCSRDTTYRPQFLSLLPQDSMGKMSLPPTFCKAIGIISEHCMITLKKASSTWQTRLARYPNCVHVGGSGWKTFCKENGIKVGDICTINIIEPMLWQVVVTAQ